MGMMPLLPCYQDVPKTDEDLSLTSCRVLYHTPDVTQLSASDLLIMHTKRLVFSV